MTFKYPKAHGSMGQTVVVKADLKGRRAVLFGIDGDWPLALGDTPAAASAALTPGMVSEFRDEISKWVGLINADGTPLRKLFLDYIVAAEDDPALAEALFAILLCFLCSHFIERRELGIANPLAILDRERPQLSYVLESLVSFEGEGVGQPAAASGLGFVSALYGLTKVYSGICIPGFFALMAENAKAPARPVCLGKAAFPLAVAFALAAERHPAPASHLEKLAPNPWCGPTAAYLASLPPLRVRPDWELDLQDGSNELDLESLRAWARAENEVENLGLEKGTAALLAYWKDQGLVFEQPDGKVYFLPKGRALCAYLNSRIYASTRER